MSEYIRPKIETDGKSYNYILGFLRVGAENAISMENLKTASGCFDRNIKSEIQKARYDGVIVCSNSHGYFFPDNVSELASFYKRMRSSAITTLSVLKNTRSELLRYGIDLKDLGG